MHADRAFGYVYSIGEDGRFKLTDVSAHSVVADMQPSSSGSGLKHMLYNDSRAIFVIGDGDGYIYIYNHNIHPPELVCKL